MKKIENILEQAIKKLHKSKIIANFAERNLDEFGEVSFTFPVLEETFRITLKKEN